MNWFTRWLKRNSKIVSTIGATTILAKDPNDPNDPNDLIHTPGNSTCWSEEKYCPQCHNNVGHNERMADYCATCAFRSPLIFNSSRLTRNIYNGEKWIVQKRYEGNGPYLLQSDSITGVSVYSNIHYNRIPITLTSISPGFFV